MFIVNYISISIEIASIDFKTRFPSLVFVTFKNTRLPLCADNWEETTAKVACKTKGFSDGERGRPTETTLYQSVYKVFWKVEFNCTGKEDFIEGCSLKAINISSKCKGDRLATVSCKGISNFPKPCYTGQRTMTICCATMLHGKCIPVSHVARDDFLRNIVWQHVASF